MKKIIKSALVIILLFGVAFGNAQTETIQNKLVKPTIENSLLWEISGNGLEKPSYLYGTVHLMCEADFLIKEKVKSAFEKSEELALELDFDDPKELQSMQKLAISPIPLSQALTQKEYATLDALLKNKFALDIKQFENYNLIGIMSTLMVKQLNCNPKVYEVEFLKMAMQRKSVIHGMETVEDQIKAFGDSYSNAEFITQLSTYDSEYLIQLIDLYKKEELNKIHQMTIDDKFMNDEEQGFMLDNRNNKWIQKMPKMMQQHSVFFAVGAAHLPGENGVINLLKKSGYTVKPI